MSAPRASVAPCSLELLESREGSTAILSLNRPESRNALTPSLLDSLRAALDRLNDDPTVKAAVLTGGGGAFSSGADLKAGSIGAKRVLLDHYNPLVTCLLTLELPVIAAIDGVAAGAGVSLAMACDFRVASPTAYFQLSFAKMGLVPDAGLTWLLPRLIGSARATEFALLARDLHAEEAKTWGLVTEVSNEGQCLKAAISLGDRLGALSSSTGAIKQALLIGAEAGLADHLRYEAELQERMQALPDFQEAVAAFRARRAPRFGGRPATGP